MATGTVQFQIGTLATPPPGLAVMADAVNDSSFGAGSVQYIKIMDGAAGGTIKAGVSAKGLAVDTGTVQVLGSIQSVGTNQALGTFQTFGTSQVLGSVQGVGTFQVLGSVQTVGTSQVLGSVQGVGTFQVLGSVQTVGTSQVLGTVQLVSIGTQQVLGSIQSVGTNQALGSYQAVGTTQTKEIRTVANPLGTRITGTIGNLVLLAANPNRLGASFYVEMGSALYLLHGSLSGTTNYTVQVTSGALYELPFGYSGTVSGIWQFASGTVQITENT